MNLNFAPPMEMEDTKEKEPFNFALNHHINVSSSSSSSASCRLFFNPTQDHMEFYHPQLYHHPQDECYGYNHRGSSSSSYEMENKVEHGLKKLRVWKREDEKLDAAQKWINNNNNNNNSSKQLDHVAKNINEVKKVMPSSSSSVETDLSSSYTPIRVCSDCHTTKTPLWRSGPKGPKSLCNACGIRQRKARRAMAAAAAEGGAPPPAKEKMAKNGQVKKRCKVAAGGGGGGGKKTGGFEDFLVNLSNKLAIHRVFPQDEKEAAILLMALSSGLVHG